MQTELNSREGAWERLCTERDPLVLSSLMWSWLEQLKDPVISTEDIEALTGKIVYLQNALDSLEKVGCLDHTGTADTVKQLKGCIKTSFNIHIK